MATRNAVQTLALADDFAIDYAAGSIVIKEGATALATYTLAGFVTSNDVNDGLATANTIAAVNNSADGVADTATLVNGTAEYDLEVGVDITISNTTFITGVESSVSGLVVRFPA